MPSSVPIRRLVPVVVVLLLVFAGQAISANTNVAAVSASGWSPDPITIDSGDTVNWSNATGFAHNVCVASAGAAAGANCSEFRMPATPSASWGGAVSHTFATPGTFRYLCEAHPNMTGTVTVRGGPAAISGKVYDDVNGNHVADPGESGVSGVTVVLTVQGQGTPTATTLTAADGAYSFDDRSPGTYVVSYQPPNGYGNTGQATHTVSLNGTDVTGRDFFTAQQNASIAGTVYDDANANGAAEPGESGLQGVSVFIDTNANGALGASEPMRTTASDGSYAFTDLLPGSYRVSYVVPSGRDNTSTRPRVVPLVAGAASTGNHFFTALGTASISGTVHDDPNGSGTADAGEVRLAGGTLGLDMNGDGQADRTTTSAAADGGYAFTGLVAGSYRVLFTPPGGFASTAPTTLNVTLARGAAANGADFFARAASTSTQPGDPGSQPPPSDGGPGPAPPGGDAPSPRSIVGTARNDVLGGSGGDETVSGLSGNDRLFGGGGNDRLLGGAGNDRLDGGSGRDALLGGAGGDKLIGGPGKDTFSGAAGNDAISAVDRIAERIDCGRGRDRAVVDRRDRSRRCERVKRR